VTPSDPQAPQNFTGYASPSAPAQRGGPAQAGKQSHGDPSGGRRLGLLAVGAVAGLALLIALAAVVTSWRVTSSVDKLRATVDKLAAAPQPDGAPGTTTESTPAPAETTEPTDATPTGSVPSLNAQTRYTVNYTKKRMRISAECSNTVYIDLDEPRVQAPSDAAELTLNTGCTTATPKLTIYDDDVQGSETESDSVTPAECNNQIQLSPLPRTGLPVRQGQVYCIMTSLSKARASAVSWKMVVLTVTSVAEDRTVALEASAWDIPY
jgi:hypothetical protein